MKDYEKAIELTARKAIRDAYIHITESIQPESQGIKTVFDKSYKEVKGDIMRKVRNLMGDLYKGY